MSKIDNVEDLSVVKIAKDTYQDISERIENLEEKALDIHSFVKGYVKKNPTKSLVYGFIAGIVFAKIIL
jgi:tetrahydromethanopterin S-methyltransferase subunit G